MTLGAIRREIPPYVSYRTFNHFLGKLQWHLPIRIDRSFWREMYSGRTSSQLMSAMLFLNMVDFNNKPAARLRVLISATGEHRAALLRQFANEAYFIVFTSAVDLQNATYSELEEVFLNNYRMESDVCRKCVRFFIEFCKDAGIPLSPQLTQEHQVSPASPGTKNVNIRKRLVANDKKNPKQLIKDHLEEGINECR